MKVDKMKQSKSIIGVIIYNNKIVINTANTLLNEFDNIIDLIDTKTSKEDKDLLRPTNNNSIIIKTLTKIFEFNKLRIYEKYTSKIDKYAQKWNKKISLNNKYLNFDCMPIRNKINKYTKKAKYDQKQYNNNESITDTIQNIPMELLNLASGAINAIGNMNENIKKEKEEEERKWLEEEMDLYNLDDEERELVLKREYNPWDFESKQDYDDLEEEVASRELHLRERVSRHGSEQEVPQRTARGDEHRVEDVTREGDPCVVQQREQVGIVLERGVADDKAGREHEEFVQRFQRLSDRVVHRDEHERSHNEKEENDPGVAPGASVQDHSVAACS